MGDLFIVPPAPTLVSTNGLTVVVEVELETEWHPVRYDWGDGTKGDWEDDLRQSHTYAQAGTYPVKVKQHCPAGLWKSHWSKPLMITV